MSAGPQDFSRKAHATLLNELALCLERPGEQQRHLGTDALERLIRYVELVVTWNRKLDLTAARGAQAQLEVLLADALVLSDERLVPPQSRVVDIGSGAGAPGLALALARSDLHLTLVEPLHKRVAFLRTVVGTLGCAARVVVLNTKLDPAHPQLTGTPFNVAMSRATFAPEIWVPAGLALGQRALALLAAQEPPPAPHGCKLESIQTYALPWSHAPRQIVAYTHEAA